MRALAWFRSDLRTIDNTALSRACAAASRGVVALFVIPHAQWRVHDYAPAKVDLILRSLRELSASLAALNIALVVKEVPNDRARAGEMEWTHAQIMSMRRVHFGVPGVVLEAAREHACDAVYFNREYELDEASRDAAVDAAFVKDGRTVLACADQAVIEPGSLRTGEGKFYTVFTPFKRAAIKVMLAGDALALEPAPKQQALMVSAPSVVPTSVVGWASSVHAALWPAGEKAALQRLRSFLATGVAGYKDERNFPAKHDATSRLSPALCVGAISPRQCIALAAERNTGVQESDKASRFDSGAPGITHWISEVLWRDFYIHIMHAFPRVATGRAFQPATDRVRWSANAEHEEAWKQGRTGVPIVDAGMRQLLRDGFVHNRVRMIVAMYFTKNLFLDWRIGERWFMRHLVDGFFPSNNGGWQWSASTGTDAAPYFRIFNPVTQSQNFDGDGAYIREYVPELRSVVGEAIHAPWTMPPLARSRVAYPEPLVDLSKSRLRAIEAFGTLYGKPVTTRVFDEA